MIIHYNGHILVDVLEWLYLKIEKIEKDYKAIKYLLKYHLGKK